MCLAYFQVGHPHRRVYLSDITALHHPRQEPQMDVRMLPRQDIERRLNRGCPCDSTRPQSRHRSNQPTEQCQDMRSLMRCCCQRMQLITCRG